MYNNICVPIYIYIYIVRERETKSARGNRVAVVARQAPVGTNVVHCSVEVCCRVGIPLAHSTGK